MVDLGIKVFWNLRYRIFQIHFPLKRSDVKNLERTQIRMVAINKRIVYKFVGSFVIEGKVEGSFRHLKGILHD